MQAGSVTCILVSCLVYSAGWMNGGTIGMGEYKFCWMDRESEIHGVGLLVAVG